MAGCSTPLTNTALDLMPFGFVLSAVGWPYWLLTVGAVVLAATRPKTRQGKAIALVIVLVVFGYLPVTAGWQAYQAHARLANAEAMFKARCKTAGEKIHRTAENVDGIFLMKVRPEDINRDDQFKMDDPYGADVTGNGYLTIFLQGKNATGSLVETDGVTRGYPYVEAIDPKDGKRYRYTGSIKVVGRKDESAPNIQIELKRNANFDLNIHAFALDKVPAPGPTPRYGVTYDDISTREERKYWIAGSSLKVVDLQTDEVMAERVGYMMDRGQGANGGGRAPWLLAEFHACPEFPKTPGGHPFKGYQTRNFVEKVLHIQQVKKDK